jgi:hypothetical protein
MVFVPHFEDYIETKNIKGFVYGRIWGDKRTRSKHITFLQQFKFKR